MIEIDTSPLATLPVRPVDGHKGTFGTVSIFGGQDGADACMIGAPALTASAALRTGCGLARLYMPRSILASAMMLEPSATGVPVAVDDGGRIMPHAMTARVDEASEGSDCIVVGPGLGLGEATQAATQAAMLRAVQQERVPAILDADALNAMATTMEIHREIRARVALTPHPGEYRRLALALNLCADLSGEASRAEAGAALASRLGCVVVLKGHRTVVSDGLRTWVCQRGGAWLATAGSGDVLSGIIGGIVAQHAAAAPMGGLSAGMRERMPVDAQRPLSLYDAARLGVELHARAGDAWREREGASGGMLAKDLCGELPKLVEAARARAC